MEYCKYLRCVELRRFVRYSDMVLVSGSDSGLASDGEQTSVSYAADNSTGNTGDTENPTPLFAHAANLGSTSSCIVTSEAIKSPREAESHDNQLLCESHSIAGTSQSTELKPDFNIVDPKDSNSISTNSSSNLQTRFSKPEDDRPPIFIGPIEEQYLTPYPESATNMTTKPSQNLSRSRSKNFFRKQKPVASISADRLKLVGRSVTSTTSMGSKSESSHVLVGTTIGVEQASCTGGVENSVTVGNLSYGGVVPPRARLVRSLAMCGDDDTRLRPPRAAVVSSLACIGFPMRSNQSSSSLSRESSHTECTSDLSEAELHSFITATLHKNPRDRALILELEQIFTNLANNSGEQSIKLPPVSSYNRMIIHRVAALFGLDHNVDNSGKCVVVSKTEKTKLPNFLFASLIQSNIFTDTNWFYPLPWNYGEFGIGELARRAQSFEIGCNLQSAKPELVQQYPLWSLGNQLPFENRHFPYYMSFFNHGSLMKKAGSFGGVPTSYQADANLETFERSQNMPGEPVNETLEQFSSISLSDSTSHTSNPSIYSGMYSGYPQFIQCPLPKDIMYTPSPYQQHVLMHPTPMVAPSSVEMFSSQSAMMVPVQSSPSMGQMVSTMPCNRGEHMGIDENSQAQFSQEMPFQHGLLNYQAHHYLPQVGGCSPQNPQSFTQAALPTHYQQAMFSQQYGPMVQQPLIHARQQYIPHPHYSATVIQSPNYWQYQQPLIHQQVQSQHRYMSTQPVVQVQPRLLHLQQPKEPQEGTALPTELHVGTAEGEQPILHEQVSFGQWLTGEEYNGSFNGAQFSSLDTKLAEAHCAQSSQRQTGGIVLIPPPVFTHPETMYHYSQISPVMSSMQEQQVFQLHYNSRPLLYKPTPYSSQQTASIDGGYCSMNQDSDTTIADA